MVHKHSFFKDEKLSFIFLISIVVLKVFGCFIYYWIYFCYYPSGFNGDSLSTMLDAKIMYNALPNHPVDFVKMILGLHSDLDTDPLYQPYFKNIEKWGRADITSDFFLNDNRTPIRINAVIMLFSFGNYAVHALVMLVLSFIGQFAFYKAFKFYFPKKEILLALITFVTPSVLFWTSGVLKEPIAMFLLGLFVYTYMKLFVERQIQIKYFFILIGSLFLFMILKPYILILVAIPLLIFVLVKRFQIKRIGLFYLAALFFLYGGAIVSLKLFFKKDVLNTIVVRQNDFVSLSKGGIFFMHNDKYVRLEYHDSTHYRLINKKNNLFQLNRHSAFMYWNTHNLRDTIYETNNKDTSYFNRVAMCAPSGSAIYIDRLQYTFSSFAKLIPQSFYNVLCKPFFYDSHSVFELMASVENFVFLIFACFCFIFKNKQSVDKNMVLLCLSIIVTGYILVGITTTVMGAIVRYKIPFVPFLLMIPLLYLDNSIFKKIPLLKRFVK